MKDINKLYDDLVEARKSQNRIAVDVLSLLHSAIVNKRIEVGHALDSNEKISVAKKQIKIVKEAMEFAINSGRNEIVEKCKNELDILNSYVPTEMSYDDVKNKVREIVSPGMDKGQAMKVAMNALRSVADGKNISKAVDEVINNG